MNFYNVIQSFCKIYCSNYSFRKCPINIKKEREYTISGDNNINNNRIYALSGNNKNIITKTGSIGWMGTICENELDKSIEEHKWKIKILKTYNNHIMVGVAPSDFDINSSSYDTCGWYLYCKASPPTLYSGPPFKYDGVKTNLGDIKDEIVVVTNLKKGQ